ncbi:unnamed protein product [Effrenium voratum]|uniref:Uncharacterized protein n=1 Tax=Effrenium voratum TaxID=2562239 RepID=A0AA36JG87_9DINO|nr:unnamed protein product [Effrenium voratum]CAJ1417999.1 unnamed protein product [Effrenium voratum]
MTKRPISEDTLCENIHNLSVSEGYQACQGQSSRDTKSSQGNRLGWYDQLLQHAPCCEANCLEWKAWANCGACLYQLGEKKASWDAYVQAAHALRGFRTQLTDDELLTDATVGKYLRTLDREFKADAWAEADDLALFAQLVQCGRASELCTERWHERGRPSG